MISLLYENIFFSIPCWHSHFFTHAQHKMRWWLSHRLCLNGLPGDEWYHCGAHFFGHSPVSCSKLGPLNRIRVLKFKGTTMDKVWKSTMKPWEFGVSYFQKPWTVLLHWVLKLFQHRIGQPMKPWVWLIIQETQDGWDQTANLILDKCGHTNCTSIEAASKTPKLRCKSKRQTKSWLKNMHSKIPASRFVSPCYHGSSPGSLVIRWRTMCPLSTSQLPSTSSASRWSKASAPLGRRLKVLPGRRWASAVCAAWLLWDLRGAEETKDEYPMDYMWGDYI